MNGVVDSRPSCPTCHNVHGTNYPKMTKNDLAIGYGSDSNGAYGYIGSLNFSYSGGDLFCKTCHADLLETLKYYRNEINFSSDCISCHDIGGIAGTGRIINSTAMNDPNAIHRDLNSGAVTTLSSENSSENKKCWACHGNGREYGNGHPSNYKTPYRCPDCHVPSSGQNLNFTPSTILNVTQHYWNGTSIGTSNTSTCYDCHNKSEMMLGTNLDPDGEASVYGGANGGNNSTSHYGKKRADLSSLQGTNEYCYNCHNNTLTVFPFIDPSNKTISNHSINNPSTNPACSVCHFTGRIHNSTLFKPQLILPNSSYCTSSCHGENGNSTFNNRSKHNGTQDCSTCHINISSSDTIHPIKYLQTSGQFNTTKTSAVNCTNCHQTGIAGISAPIIPDPLKHSSNLSNGTIWNTYWIDQGSSCYYCHGDTKHNETALGTINNLLSTNNTRNGSISTTTWCASCHYNGSANPNYKGTLWNQAPPLITVKNTINPLWVNHSTYLTGGYGDQVCENCHALNGTQYLSTSLNFSHSLDIGIAGNPNCIQCHDLTIGLSAPAGINFSASNLSVHFGMNSQNATDQGYANVTGSCWACHDSD
ncbi:MAG: cytochrome c3 family protein, partial [Candidatus Methanoperedens sp.]|nr:cytochrome c3 family protein [Candidatus Methanoperedens sp.]